MRAEEFKRLMHAVAEAWSDGKAEKAADYYTEQALIEFCGSRMPKLPIKIIWFHLSFNEEQQVGFGEYRYQRFEVGERRTHTVYGYRAIATVKVSDGMIVQWREYRG